MRTSPVRPWLGLVPLLVLAGSCSGPAPIAVVPPHGWLTEIATKPEVWMTTVDGTSREGWSAFHAHQYEEAITAFRDHKPARARAELALAVLHDDIDRVERVASRRLFERWAERGELPQGAAAVAGLNELCHGNSAGPWLARVSEGPGSGFAAAVTTGEPLWPTASGSGDPILDRRYVHAQARGGQPDALRLATASPMFSIEATGEGFAFERRFWDPCAHRTLADYWFGQVAADLGGPLPRAATAWTGLDGRLFAAWATADDVAAEANADVPPAMFGATMPSLSDLRLGREPSGEDRREIAREEARMLESALDQWRTALAEDAPPEGLNLLDELHLFDRFRQEWLLARARKHLAEGRRAQALALAHLARDASQGVGPANAPSVYAILAAAELENGHTREALDALQILARARTDLVSVREIVSDLAVLEGIDRTGDSKEN